MKTKLCKQKLSLQIPPMTIVLQRAKDIKIFYNGEHRDIQEGAVAFVKGNVDKKISSKIPKLLINEDWSISIRGSIVVVDNDDFALLKNISVSECNILIFCITESSLIKFTNVGPCTFIL